LIVYVPPGYAESKERFPVLYLQDGQNLFDPATAFGGQDWRVDVTADEMIAKREIRPSIIVGIYHTGRQRISEYSPTRNREHRKGGKASRYAEMLAREIKPFIDKEYRTLKAARSTAVGGSSLGGLVSLVAGLEYPRVFGQMAILSPSVWWDHRAILRWVHNYRERLRPRMWLDCGTNEGSSPQQLIEDLRILRTALLERGWQEGKDLSYHEIPGAEHSESAWAARFGAVLAYLFGTG
jgi:predicted alpha/beta superfamily hydrolase